MGPVQAGAGPGEQRRLRLTPCSLVPTARPCLQAEAVSPTPGAPGESETPQLWPRS